MSLVWGMLLLAIVQTPFLSTHCTSLGNTSFPVRMNKWPQDNAYPSNRCQWLELRGISSYCHWSCGFGFPLVLCEAPNNAGCQPLHWINPLPRRKTCWWRESPARMCSLSWRCMEWGFCGKWTQEQKGCPSLWKRERWWPAWCLVSMAYWVLLT